MLPTERRKQIQKIISAEKNISIPELMERLQISRSTLYRDLQHLKKDSLISAEDAQTIPVPPNYEEQQEIVQTAVQMICEIDSIFLGEGLLCLLLAKKIREQNRLKNITVVTNNFNAALELVSHIAHVYLLGGNLLQNVKSYYTGGPRMENNLSTIFVSKAFASVDGVDIQSGYTMHELSQLGILTHLPDFSAQTIFLIPSDCFGFYSIHQLAPLNFADKIITDHNLPENLQKSFSSMSKPELILSSSPTCGS